MKLNIDWKTLGKQLWEAVKPVLLAAIGGGVVSYAASDTNTAVQTNATSNSTSVAAQLSK